MRVTGDPETSPQSAQLWLGSLIWPRWLPLQARLPLIAQIAGAMALVAAVAMRKWTIRPSRWCRHAARSPRSPGVCARLTCCAGTTVEPVRPAHLNLDVRHSLRSVDLSVTVDGKSVLETKLAGSGKRFGVVGKRCGPGFTRTSTWLPACGSSRSACDPRRRIRSDPRGAVRSRFGIGGGDADLGR